MFLSATVKLSSSRSCFACLSLDLAQQLPTVSESPGSLVVLQVEWPAGLVYVSWSGDIAVNRSDGFEQAHRSILELGKKFADLNGIKIGEEVALTLLDGASSCTRVSVDPMSIDDWEILELHAGFIESSLLNQVRVVWSGQVVPVWINKHHCIAIKIGDLEPVEPCVVLKEFTEVFITSKQREQSMKNDKTNRHFNGIFKEINPNRPNSDISVSEESTLKSSLYHLWNYLFSEPEEDSTQENPEYTRTVNQLAETFGALNDPVICTGRMCCKPKFSESDLDLCLRSQLVFQNSDENLNDEGDVRRRQISCVFVNPDSIGVMLLTCNHSNQRHISLCLNDFEGYSKIVAVRKLLSPREKQDYLNIDERKSSRESDARKEDSRELPVLKSVPVRMVLSNGVLPGHIIMHQHLLKQLGVGGISRFLLSHVNQEPLELQGIILHPVKDFFEKDQDTRCQEIIDSFCNWVAMVTTEEHSLLIWNGITVTFECHGCFLEFIINILSHSEDTRENEHISFYNITPSILDGIKVVVGDKKTVPKTPALIWQMQSKNTAQLMCTIKDLGGFDQPFNKGLFHLSISLEKSLLSSYLSGGLTKGLGNGAILICGSDALVGEGCGKTSLGHALCCKLQKWPVCAHVIVMDSIPLRGKRVETIQKLWQQAFLEAAWHQPSVILLDNLDHVISAPSLGQEMGGEGLYRLRLVQVFKDLVTAEIVKRSQIAVIATSRSHDSLNTALKCGYGLHIFQCCVQLGSLNESQRLEVLYKLIQRKFHGVNQIEVETAAKSVAKQCQGFSPKDLSALVDRALHFAVVRQLKSNQEHPINLVMDDLNQALTGYSPASLRGVQLHKPGELSWSDVGGLKEVRKALQETFLWPTKYAALLAKSQLHLRSGLLLYGPPGTGKTLLAGVLAKESALNFISIKGPELLSKYIGASEQAVRDVFVRAQTARPCILFFDEFEALAPHRGHDSTGVTDRVVNQLLTQLDGVEGLEGVYILAATSRPGLIDPALLRPGRLDKCVYCPIPNESERHEILQVLTRGITLADDIDLKSIASKCEHFTGADLKALLYNAQLESIHRKTSQLKLYGSIFNESDGITEITAKTRPLSSIKEGVSVIQQSDFDKAMPSMRPSVSPKERLVNENINDSFMQSRGKSFTANTPVKGKATLA